ncbi:SMC-Scp complex subunit ScpB [Virgibacillus necropolis]|uniref:Segregation and condensation protein B n=1 Tax=Virgibacillus necropolis TaxID=163877 RepID=A0A221MCY3_9BACI|nr:SMC-Scp complex subunit ScpB [Virgibacillus necropolis]ASN05470.1 SMC-Scp complex subunit ScpB [Virgibacillus necropolis]
MRNVEHKAIVEGLLFASGDTGITAKQLAKIIEVNQATIEYLLEELRFDYDHTDRGIKIMQSHDTFHLTTKPQHSQYFQKLFENPKMNRMSQAALETLAIIAYQQPITRTEIEEIRGVKSDRSVQTLLARSLIEEVGRRETIGRPILFSTSKEFLTYFGLSSIEELPPLPENLEEGNVEQEADLFFEKFNQELENE